MLLEACSWKDVEKRIRTDNRIVLVLGATEEHADLSLCADTLIPFEIARRACEKANVLLAPPLPFGVSTWSLSYPGTISLKISTMVAVVEDILASLCNSGFRRFFVLNGHGLNRAVEPVFGERALLSSDYEVIFQQWWELPAVQLYFNDNNLIPSHANWSEAFTFTRLTTKRSVVPRVNPMPNLLQHPSAIRAELKEGHGPGPVEIDRKHMDTLVDIAVNDFFQLLISGNLTNVC